MKLDKLETAIDEAERFLKKAHVAYRMFTAVENSPSYGHLEYTKETAACTRASMDLTRALADLRRSS
jgi:hypothetical protein